MRRRGLLAATAALLLAAALLGGLSLWLQDEPSSEANPSLPAPVTLPRTCSISDQLVPTCGVWWGAAQVPGGPASLLSLEERLGRPLPIGHLYHSDGEVFPTPDEVVFADRDGGPGLLFINVKPGSLATGQITWSEVAAGGADDYLNAIGRELRRYDRPLFMTLHHEPEDEVDPTPGSGQTAADYVAMFRHAVDQVESQAPDAQITWVWNVTGYPRWESLWPQLYPGDHYVDWIAYDPYLQEPAGCDISCVVNRTYQEFPEWDGFYAWATERYPGKTLMLGEWGVRESPDDALAKAELFRSAPAILANDFPGLRALVYFNDDKSPDDPTSTRLETSAASLEAFRETVAHPYLSSAARKAPRS